MKVAPLYIQPSDDRRTVSAVPWELLLDPRLAPMTKLVAAVLWGHMNPAGECSPGQEELARICGVSVRTVKRATREMRRTLWLEVQSRSKGVTKLPSVYRARHPIHGPVKRPKVPEQMALTLMTMQRGPKLVRGTPMAPARDTSDPFPGDTGGPLTKAGTTEQIGDKSPGTANGELLDGWERGGALWQQTMDALKAAHVLPPKAALRRDGER